MKNIFPASLLTCILITFVGCFGDSGQSAFAQTVQNISVEEFRKKLESKEGLQLIDVRTPEEYASGHIKNATNININDNSFIRQIETLDKELPILVYCRSGSRSAKAADQMKQNGFKTIFNLNGGIMAWTNEGQPVEKGSVTSSDKFTKSDFQKLIHSDLPIMVDFYAKWCVPCKKMEPALDSLSKEFSGKVKIARVDLDEAKELAKEMEIRMIPVVNTYKDGKQVATAVGYRSQDQLRSMINGLIQ